MGAPRKPACVDENELAALTERRLAPAERERFERHVDRCRACRTLVAEVARSLGGPARRSIKLSRP